MSSHHIKTGDDMDFGVYTDTTQFVQNFTSKSKNPSRPGSIDNSTSNTKEKWFNDKKVLKKIK